MNTAKPSWKLQEWEKQAIADACAAGEKRDAVAAEFGVHPSNVTRIAQKHGVPPGTPGVRPTPKPPKAVRPEKQAVPSKYEIDPATGIRKSVLRQIRRLTKARMKLNITKRRRATR